MNDKQIKKMYSGIVISDVISYIDAHQKEYKKFLENESKEEKNELHKTKQSKKTINKVSS